MSIKFVKNKLFNLNKISKSLRNNANLPQVFYKSSHYKISSSFNPIFFPENFFQLSKWPFVFNLSSNANYFKVKRRFPRKEEFTFRRILSIFENSNKVLNFDNRKAIQKKSQFTKGLTVNINSLSAFY